LRVAFWAPWPWDAPPRWAACSARSHGALTDLEILHPAADPKVERSGAVVECDRSTSFGALRARHLRGRPA
jgi:hypothetical protein